ncbi:MAG: peptidoglycan recognition family protein [Chloroflexota bacterium]
MRTRPTLALVVALLASLALASEALAWSPPLTAGTAVTAAQARLTADELKPPIVRRFIPYPAKRAAQMRDYSLRHYGDHTEILTDPKVIVEHYTTSHDWRDAWWYFAANRPARGERPGVCSHFVIGTDGTIYQVMPLTIRCRHATGLNNTAIGIEDAGISDKEIMNNKKEMEASYRLTLWLMAKFSIPVKDVIGHNEIIFSPWHHDLVPRFRCMRHEDWNRRHMTIYRHELRRRAVAAGIDPGPAPVWVHPHC